MGLHTVSPSGQHLSGLSADFSAGRFLRNEGREGWKRGEDAIFLSLAKYTPSGSIMDRISAGQEMILVRSRKQRRGVGEFSRVGLGKGQLRVPMGQDRVCPAATREWQHLCCELVGRGGGEGMLQGQGCS